MQLIRTRCLSSEKLVKLQKNVKMEMLHWEEATTVAQTQKSDGSIRKNRKSGTILRLLVDTHELWDSWQCLNPKERDFSFYETPHKIHTLIDMNLISKSLLSNARTIKQGGSVWSGHGVSYQTSAVITSAVTYQRLGEYTKNENLVFPYLISV